MLTLRPAGEILAADWDAVVDAIPDAWFWHRRGWLAYQRAYYTGDGDVDRSAAVMEDGRIVGLLPLIVRAGGRAVMDGRPGPVFTDAQVARRASGLVLDHVRRCGVTSWTFAGIPQRARPDFGRAVETRIVDLRETEAALWRGVRRSYHALIHRAEHQHAIRVGAGDHLAVCYMRAHQASATRPRSGRTYSLQMEWARAGQAAIALAFRHGDDGDQRAIPVAAAYAIVYKRRAYYASGPSTERDVQHAVQWALVKHLAAIGAEYYETGYLPDDPSDKDRGIQKFKEGFGGDAWYYELSDVSFRPGA